MRLQQSASQLLKLALDDGADPAAEPAAFQALLARIASTKTYPLWSRPSTASVAAPREVYRRLLG